MQSLIKQLGAQVFCIYVLQIRYAKAGAESFEIRCYLNLLHYFTVDFQSLSMYLQKSSRNICFNGTPYIYFNNLFLLLIAPKRPIFL